MILFGSRCAHVFVRISAPRFFHVFSMTYKDLIKVTVIKSQFRHLLRVIAGSFRVSLVIERFSKNAVITSERLSLK